MSASRPLPTVRARANWDHVRYANVWEDADVLCEALEPVAAGARLLSIASAGDNALALLTLDPAEVVAADLSAAQLACLELRRVAFRRLEHEEMLVFLGANAGANRLTTYARLRSELPEPARGFWDSRPREMAKGILHAGRFEHYFGLFRHWVLPWVHGRATREALLRPRSADAQRAFYAERWDTARWRFLFRLFFSRAVMGRMGRDPAFFTHVDGAVGARILERTRHALTEIPVATNPYLTFIMTSSFTPDALPRYLRVEHFAFIRDRLPRLRCVQGPIESAATGQFTGFNLSDLFEYQNPDEHAACYARLVASASAGARLVYWNMLVPRGIPAGCGERVRSLDSLASELHARDRAWFYGQLHVDEVVS